MDVNFAEDATLATSALKKLANTPTRFDLGSPTATQAIEWLLEKSSITVKIIKQNLFLAISAIVIASSFSLLGMMPLWLSVILHEGGTVIVGLNSLRLLKKTL